MKTYNLAELAALQLKNLGMHQEEERARWFDSVMTAPTEYPTDCPFHVAPIHFDLPNKPVQTAIKVAHDRLEKDVIKFAQGQVFWFPGGHGPSMIVNDAPMLQVVATVELQREISATTAELVLKVLQAAHAARIAREAKARAEQ